MIDVASTFWHSASARSSNVAQLSRDKLSEVDMQYLAIDVSLFYIQ